MQLLLKNKKQSLILEIVSKNDCVSYEQYNPSTATILHWFSRAFQSLKLSLLLAALLKHFWLQSGFYFKTNRKYAFKAMLICKKASYCP